MSGRKALGGAGLGSRTPLEQFQSHPTLSVYVKFRWLVWQISASVTPLKSDLDDVSADSRHSTGLVAISAQLARLVVGGGYNAFRTAGWYWGVYIFLVMPK